MNIVELIERGVIHTETLILEKAETLDLTLEQIGFLLLFYRHTKKTSWLLPSSQQFAKQYHLDVNDVKRLQNTLFQNGYCEIESKTTESTLVEYINWQFLYTRLQEGEISAEVPGENKLKIEIVKLLEREFARMLSPMEIELAGIWSQSYSKDNVIDAIKEAVIADIKNLKYIDKILLNWSQGGRRTTVQLKEKAENGEEVQLDMYYNWLENGEK